MRWILAFCLFSGFVHAEILSSSFAVDLLAASGKGDKIENNGLIMREAEAAFYGAIDHNFEGLLSMAAHPENGETVFEVHEAYIKSSRLWPRFRFKAGQFFLGVTRLAKFHRHDWPFTDAPQIVQKVFADDEGAEDSGLELGYLLPTSFYLDIQAGLTSGYTYGHTHTEGKKPISPTHYLRLTHFLSRSTQSGIEFGLNHLKRVNGDGQLFEFQSLDIIYKQRIAKRLKWLSQNEFFTVTDKSPTGVKDTTNGGYAYLGFGFNQSQIVGLRMAHMTTATSKTNNGITEITPQWTYISSEFAKIIASYDHRRTISGSKTTFEDRYMIQTVFILGAHPAHAF